jgi:hypothetical protein
VSISSRRNATWPHPGRLYTSRTCAATTVGEFTPSLPRGQPSATLGQGQQGQAQAVSPLGRPLHHQPSAAQQCLLPHRCTKGAEGQDRPL